MKAIEGVELADIVQQAAQEIVDEKQVGVRSLIKSKLNELNQATTRIADLEKQLTKERQKAERLQEWLGKVQAGDWTVIELSERKPEDKEK